MVSAQRPVVWALTYAGTSLLMSGDYQTANAEFSGAL